MWLAFRYNYSGLLKIIDVHKCFIEYMKSGQPFEIVDGDNNECFVEYFKPLINELKELKTTCVTILGP